MTTFKKKQASIRCSIFFCLLALFSTGCNKMNVDEDISDIADITSSNAIADGSIKLEPKSKKEDKVSIDPIEEDDVVVDNEGESEKFLKFVDSFTGYIGLDKESIEQYTSIQTKFYDEIKHVSAGHTSLKTGKWFMLNSNIKNGVETAKELGIMSSHSEKFLEENTPIETIMRNIEDFESLFRSKHDDFRLQKFNKDDALRFSDDFKKYALSLVLLRTMLETKDVGNDLKYVGDDNSGKKISTKSANAIIDKTNIFFNLIDITAREMNWKNDESSNVAKASHLHRCKKELKKLDDLIGGSIQSKLSNLDQDSVGDLKKQLKPESLLWTWINDKSLVDGSWDSILNINSNDKSVINLMYDLETFAKEYQKIIDEITTLTKGQDRKDAENKLLPYINKLKKNKDFINLQKKGKEAIILLRKIVQAEELYDIGYINGKAKGFKYIGKWRKDDTSSQVDTQKAEEFVDQLDCLSAIATFLDSMGELRLPLHTNRLLRNNESLHIFETKEEEAARKALNSSNRSLFMSRAAVIMGVTALLPLTLPVVLPITLVALGVAVLPYHVGFS